MNYVQASHNYQIKQSFMTQRPTTTGNQSKLSGRSKTPTFIGEMRLNKSKQQHQSIDQQLQQTSMNFNMNPNSNNASTTISQIDPHLKITSIKFNSYNKNISLQPNVTINNSITIGNNNYYSANNNYNNSANLNKVPININCINNNNNNNNQSNSSACNALGNFFSERQSPQNVQVENCNEQWKQLLAPKLSFLGNTTNYGNRNSSTSQIKEKIYARNLLQNQQLSKFHLRNIVSIDQEKNLIQGQRQSPTRNGKSDDYNNFQQPNYLNYPIHQREIESQSPQEKLISKRSKSEQLNRKFIKQDQSSFMKQMNQLFKPGSKPSYQLNDKDIERLNFVQQGILKQQFDQKIQEYLNSYRLNENSSNSNASQKKQFQQKQKKQKIQKFITFKQNKHLQDQYDKIINSCQDRVMNHSKMDLLQFYIKNYKNEKPKSSQGSLWITGSKSPQPANQDQLFHRFHQDESIDNILIGSSMTRKLLEKYNSKCDDHQDLLNQQQQLHINFFNMPESGRKLILNNNGNNPEYNNGSGNGNDYFYYLPDYDNYKILQSKFQPFSSSRIHRIQLKKSSKQLKQPANNDIETNYIKKLVDQQKNDQKQNNCCEPWSQANDNQNNYEQFLEKYMQNSNQVNGQNQLN